MKSYLLTGLAVLMLSICVPRANAQIQEFDLLNAPLDVSPAFRSFENTYYLADSLAEFNEKTGEGSIKYSRYEYVTRQAFNNMLGVIRPVKANEFPTTEYEEAPKRSFKVELITDKTIRIKAISGPQLNQNEASLLLVNGKAEQHRNAWKYKKVEGGHQYYNENGSVTIYQYPWRIEFKDAQGRLLTKSVHNADFTDSTYTPVMPFSYVRRASDYSRSYSAAFSLQPGEKMFGFGESFTQLNKRGQRVVLWTDDANGTQNETMYKPIPFFMSNRGYGMFIHTSSPITCDVGKYFNAVNSLMIGDDELDVFVFLGEPKDILDEYTELTGKPSMPPLWSFGLWMSRITYFSEADGRKVASDLRKNKVPADVIHFDTGWFGVDWRNDYQFASDRFDNPSKMISDLKKDGFHISLWQLPYFTPKNTLYPELVDKGLVVKDFKGNLPYEDAVLDFSNPETVDWYQSKIGNLIKMGVGAIKVDFGEAAPVNGIYHSGRTGFYEHNLYPLRYNKAVADVTKDVSGENIIWARSAWAGSQRYPLHWGGDAANSNTAMAASLRAGLSFGLSGFSFWSNDIGGFVMKTPESLYRRWTPFGLLTSHSRTHGAPPKEPWEYSKDFLKEFRLADNMRYQLMPYIYAQAKQCTEKGLPMVRALFVEYPNDPGAWLVDDQYLFGSDILVAPLFEEVNERAVYLPAGEWIDYQTGKSYQGGWHNITAGEIPIIMLVKSGSVIPHIKLAQSTMEMDWSQLELKVYANNQKQANGVVYLPGKSDLAELTLNSNNGKYELVTDPYKGEVKWKVSTYNDK
ncbi:alpha-xylosidase [Fulvivirga maritima]|uniref:glycoside hydrolase family 31 protein n=1 Tax=Fulvivirga maritima TaxID=2904247 RepID=UPI001F46D705|nr:alpha-xylosidase [Fulvivirga maritima]UII24607.1 alpha-xylosidase [Fulvivirga maritima]